MCGVVLEGGTLTSSAGPWMRAPSTAVPLWGGVDRSLVRRGWFVGTLLGPERAGCPGVPGSVDLCRAGLYLIPLSSHAWGAGLVGSGGRCLWLVVENCTVDASIF